MLCGARVPHKRLSEPFEALTLDLQRRVDDITFQRLADEASGVKSLWERQRSLAVPVTEAGICNAVVFWFQVCKRLPVYWANAMSLR